MPNKITIDNCRDMGGLTTDDGKVFKHGKLYRTASLYAKTCADKRFIESLNLDTIIDFRNETEVSENPDYVPSGVEYVYANVLKLPEHKALVFSKQEKTRLLKLTSDQSQLMLDTVLKTYRYMPFAAEEYAELFDRMDEGKTIAFHCTAGKDRTGIAAMLIEMAFNRNLEDIRSQYMLSNEFRAATNKRILRILKLFRASKIGIEACMYALTNHVENFDLAISTILSRYPNIPSFLDEVHGITPERIKNWETFYIEQ